MTQPNGYTTPKSIRRPGRPLKKRPEIGTSALVGLGNVQIIPDGDETRTMSITDHLQRVAVGQIQVKDRELPVTPQEYLAEMLWSFIVTGRAKFADGVEMRVPNHDQWMKVVRWVTERIDGPPPKEVLIKKQTTSTNIDLSGYTIEDLERLRDLTLRLQGEE